MAEMAEVVALRLQNEALKEENARLKATRAAIYKMYIESEGVAGNAVRNSIFSRQRVFEALQLSADANVFFSSSAASAVSATAASALSVSCSSQAASISAFVAPRVPEVSLDVASQFFLTV